MKNVKSHLSLQTLMLDVRLGFSDEERIQKQKVKMNIDIIYPKPPLACETDELNDTFCYAGLIEQIKYHVDLKSFRLLEFLGQDLYRMLKTVLPSHLKVRIQVTKWPAIANLDDGVCFSIGDFE